MPAVTPRASSSEGPFWTESARGFRLFQVRESFPSLARSGLRLAHCAKSNPGGVGVRWGRRGSLSAQESSVRGFLFPGEGKVLKTVTKHVVNSELS